MQTLQKGKLKLVLAIVLLLLALAVFFVVLQGVDINTASICQALLYAELPLVFGILLLVLSIRDIKDGQTEKQWEERRKRSSVLGEDMP